MTRKNPHVRRKRDSRVLPPPKSRDRLQAAWPIVLGLLFLVALIWRLAYQARLASTPFLTDLSADAKVYWDWSAALLRSGFWDARPYFLSPLYPCLLAIVRSISGDSVRGVATVQAVFDAASVVLLADAVRRATTHHIGAAVGLLLCFYEMTTYFTGLVLLEPWLLFLEALLVWMASAGLHRRLAGLAAMGGAIGLMSVGRATNLALCAPAALLLAEWRANRLRAVFALGVAVACPVLAATAHNRVVGGEWTPITYSGGMNFYIGNNEHASGSWVPVAPSDLRSPEANVAGKSLDGTDEIRRALGREVSAGESSKYWSGLAWSFIRDHPGRALRLTAQKIGMIWSWREYPQVENVEVFRRVAGPIGLPGLGTFAFLGTIALGGMWWAWRSGVAARFALGYALALTVATAPFFVVDRFRVHLLPGVVVLAGIAINRVWVALRGGEAKAIARGAAALAFGAAVVALPAPHFSANRMRWGTAYDIGSRWLQHERPELALPYLEEAAKAEREDAEGRRSTEVTRGERGRLHLDLAIALLSTGQREGARPWLALASREIPDDPRLNRVLAALR